MQQEGQPLVVLEAMAAGVPIIFTNRGCLRETVSDNKAGAEVPINDSEALAEKLLWMMDHPSVLQKMGMEGRHRYESLYTKDHHIKCIGEVFDSVCEGRMS